MNINFFIPNDKFMTPEINDILGHLHDSSILLLYAISKTNADVLGDVIDEARKSGYEIYLLP